LGIKQLTPDPWDLIPEKYKPGTRVSGPIKSVTDFGLFVELEEGIEGLVHVSQLPKGKGSKPLKEFQVMDEIEAEVINLSPDEKRIGLSVRKLEESAERDIQKDYVNNRQQATSNLGELLKGRLAESQPQTANDSQE
jgi:small subunit ribosomal protein S1